MFAAGLLLGGCGASDATSAGVNAIAVAGEAAPDLPDGYLLEGIDPNYTMGAAGHVLFSGSANIQRGSAADRKKVLWFGQPGTLQAIIETGQPIPDMDGDAQVSDFSPLPRIVTRSGDAAFIVRPSVVPRGYLPQALLAYRDGTLETVVANGRDVPVPEGSAPLLSISQFVMTDAGVLIMGEFARRRSALWFWDFSTLRLVIADDTETDIGRLRCKIRSLASTTLDMNSKGFAVFRASTFGNDCTYGGTIGWDSQSNTLVAVTMNRQPIAPDSTEHFQSTTGDARISDDGHIALHAELYDIEAQANARSMTMLQRKAGGPTTGLLDKSTPIDDAPDLQLTHAIHGNGMAPLGDGGLAHFVRNNRDRIILRSQLGGKPQHRLIAHQTTTVDDSVAARIGNAAANRDGDIVLTSFIDDGKPGGTYQQQLWLSARNGDLSRLAYPGSPVVNKDNMSVERIEASNQSHEPTMVSTQGGRSRTIADNGSYVFAGRVQQESGAVNALFVAYF
ncbi:MAG: hypothetical protein AAFO81_12025 [Pseudomonadota bacterium]